MSLPFRGPWRETNLLAEGKIHDPVRRDVAFHSRTRPSVLTPAAGVQSRMGQESALPREAS